MLFMTQGIFGQSVIDMEKQNKDKKLFTLLSSSMTGINFRNDIIDTKESNIFIHKNFYQGGGVAIEDINNDGLQDIYFAGNQVGDRLYLNKGNLQFEDITEKAGIENDDTWSTGVTIIDINDDGFKDINVCKGLYHHQPERRKNKLYINNGNTTFTESAAKYGIDDPWRTQHASFLDYDRDGDFDIFIINQPPNPSKLLQIDPSDGRFAKYMYRLLENKGDKFEDITAKAGLLNVGYGLSAAVGDFDNDGWQDIYVANDYDGPDFFYINNRDGTFTNKIDECFRHISYFSMGSDVGDINNDGWLDLIVVDMVAEDNYRLKANMSSMDPGKFWKVVKKGGHYQYMFNTLQLNNGLTDDGNIVFSDIAQMAGISNTDWSWSPLLADFDNDGYLDLFVTNGIKHEMRNTDALAKMDDYIKVKVDKYRDSHQGSTDFKIWDLIDIEEMLSFFPSVKLQNYMYRNQNGLRFAKKTDEWGLGQFNFSTGAAYGDLDNDGDLDLVVSNLDDEAHIYENNLDKISKNHYLRIRLTAGKKNTGFYGTRATLYYQGQMQIAEVSSASGISSSSEGILHFGLGKYDKVDSIRINWYAEGFSVVKNVKSDREITVDMKKAVKREGQQKVGITHLFEDITEKNNIDYVHHENAFNDYEREVLLPHKMSTLGAGLAVGDINGDGLDDFFVGGAIASSGKLYEQRPDGTFVTVTDFSPYPYHEDMGGVFFDADLDGDQDLYVVSGGNEYDPGVALYQDRLYVNNGQGKFNLSSSALPDIAMSGSRVKEADYDGDGDMDLFVCGRQVPGNYPRPAESYILKNEWKEQGRLTFSQLQQPVLKALGMVTDAAWSDYDADGDLDLVVSGVWMPLTILENRNGHFTKFEIPQFEETVGWWYSVTASDLDGDGDEDYIFGNLGLNYKYKASKDAPFTIHYDDFDNNGHQDIVLGYYNYGKHFPLRGRSCSSDQVPGIKRQFHTYHAFASASLADVYGQLALTEALYYEARQFASICLENKGNGKFSIRHLPEAAQLSNINSSIVVDVDGDGVKDIVAAGNLYGSEVETPRNDAGIGLYLKGNGDCTFESVAMFESGLNLPYDVKEIKPINVGEYRALLVMVNDGPVRLIKLVE